MSINKYYSAFEATNFPMEIIVLIDQYNFNELHEVILNKIYKARFSNNIVFHETPFDCAIIKSSAIWYYSLILWTTRKDAAEEVLKFDGYEWSYKHKVFYKSQYR